MGILNRRLKFYNAYIHIRETGRFEEGYEQRKAILEELAKAGQKGRSGLFVFVIGESHTRDRMTAYGPQEHETTPWLKDMRSDRNFILFDKAYTSYVATENSYLRERCSQTREHPRFLFT